MQYISFLFLTFAISTPSFAAIPGNAIKSCNLEVSENGKIVNMEIPAHHPGAELKDGAYCNETGMQIYKKFKALDNSSWILSLYADHDRNQNTHFVHRIYESKTKEPPQIDLVLNQAPCDFLDKDGTGLSAQLKSAGAARFRLSCLAGDRSNPAMPTD